MNEERKNAVLRTGIIPPPALAELERWGVDIPAVEVTEDTREALEDVREAVESYDTVLVRHTDPNALPYFQEKEQLGRLYFTVPAGNKRKTSFVEVAYAVYPTGEYILPWKDEDIADIMMDEGTYLKPTGEERVYFQDMTELYYGEKKVFMVCTPVKGESHV